MGILSQPLSRGAALFGVIAIGVAISGTFPQKQGLSLQISQFVHVLSIAMVVGVGDWTTFVFGIVAFKNLPRQTFGQLQVPGFSRIQCWSCTQTSNHFYFVRTQFICAAG